MLLPEKSSPAFLGEDLGEVFYKSRISSFRGIWDFILKFLPEVPFT
jgi:hypothetical protein